MSFQKIIFPTLKLYRTIFSLAIAEQKLFSFISFCSCFFSTIKKLLKISSPLIISNFEFGMFYSWFSHDVTKIQTKKLSLLLSFYCHLVLEHLKTFIQTNSQSERVLRFAIQDALISRLLRDAAFSWRPEKFLCLLKTLRILGDFAV